MFLFNTNVHFDLTLRTSDSVACVNMNFLMKLLIEYF